MVVGTVMDRHTNCTDFKGQDRRNKAGEVGRWQTMTVDLGSAVRFGHSPLWPGKSMSLLVWSVVLSGGPTQVRQIDGRSRSFTGPSLGRTGTCALGSEEILFTRK